MGVVTRVDLLGALVAVTGAERALARIDDGAIERNCRRLLELTGGAAELCAVVKADGYGHGAAQAARAALRGGATWLAVATAGEAVALREQGLDGRLLVMGALTRAELEAAVDADADVVVWTRELAAAAGRLAGARVHVKLDTGMGRLGTKDAELARALAGDGPARGADDPLRDRRRARRRRCSASSSSASATFVAEARRRPDRARRQQRGDPARPGRPLRHGALRRGRSTASTRSRATRPTRGLEPALALESWVAALRRFEAGDGAGYGRRWRAPEPTWVATVPIGYGDGWRRGLSNDCDVLIGGRRYPVVGTVSMDNVTVDLGPDTGGGGRATR